MLLAISHEAEHVQSPNAFGTAINPIRDISGIFLSVIRNKTWLLSVHLVGYADVRMSILKPAAPRYPKYLKKWNMFPGRPKGLPYTCIHMYAYTHARYNHKTCLFA